MQTPLTEVLTRAAKGDDSLVRVSAFVDFLWDNDEGYRQAVEETDGVLADIEASNWSGYMTDLAATSVATRRFTLDHPADESSIQVWHEGSLLDSADWSFDPATNAVQLDESAVALQDGDELTIDYAEPATCP